MPLTPRVALIALLSMICASAIADELRLKRYEATWTRGDLRWQLDQRYAPGAWRSFLQLSKESVSVTFADSDTPLSLALREPMGDTSPTDPQSTTSPSDRWCNWVPALPPPNGRLKVVFDPGHLGGEFAELEGRSWSVGDGPVFREGDETLAVARLAAKRLRELGVEVALVRDTPGPVTDEPRESYTEPRQWYVGAEIRARAERINRELQPDLVIALHFNAVAWEDPANPSLVDENHAHILVNGSYGQAELDAPDQRLAMLERLLSGVGFIEESLAEGFTEAIRKTGLPPFAYGRDNAHRVNANPYLWSRNLLANRLYRCPVIYLELYVANSRSFYTRWAEQPATIHAEYAQVIVDGLRPWIALPSESAKEH